MLQTTGYPAEIADFYSAISAGYWGVFLVAKTVQLDMTHFFQAPATQADHYGASVNEFCGWGVEKS